MLHARKDYNKRIQDNANLIPEDEPVFLLRGQDKLAASALSFYIDLLENDKNSNKDVIDACSNHLEAFEKWRRTHSIKSADMPEGMSIY